MGEKPPFDPQKMAFWLVTFVIVVECFIVLGGTFTCLYFSETILRDPKIQCDPDGRLFQLLGAALAAALALAGSRRP